jgi:hypothetical protein
LAGEEVLGALESVQTLLPRHGFVVLLGIADLVELPAQGLRQALGQFGLARPRRAVEEEIASPAL